MSHAFHQLYYHFIWTTHSRESLIERLWRIKGAASYRVNHELRPRFKLRWQEGYGVLTLRRDEVEQVGRYIDEQEEHHRKGKISVLLERAESEEDSPEGTISEAP